MTYFRRDHYPMAPNQKPRWHVVADWSSEAGRITAVCGYTYKFILEEPMLREVVKTASLRCSKCDKKKEI
jgi:hypothetical protein